MIIQHYCFTDLVDHRLNVAKQCGADYTIDVYKRQNWRRAAMDRVDWRRRLVEARARLGL